MKTGFWMIAAATTLSMAAVETAQLRDHAAAAMDEAGARGLRSILESVLLDTMYDLPSLDSVAKVIIDGSVIKGESDPMLMYENKEPAKAAQED